MKLPIHVMALLLALTGWSESEADIYDSRPSEEVLREATAQCRPAKVRPVTDIVGISDPHAIEANVVSLIQETGVKWVRAEFKWSKIQDSPASEYDWRAYDAMVDSYNRAGIKVAGILTYIPPAMPDDWLQIDEHFQRFASATVKHFAAKGVHYWEVFNEPNLTGYGWLQKGLDARDFLGAYTLLLARANQAVRANDPQGVVILGGLASDNHSGIPAEDAMSFIYGAGGRRCFDVFAFHPYGYQNKFSAARARMNAILAAGADMGKPIWFNEYGWTDYAEMDMRVNGTAANNPMMAVFDQRRQADALFWFSAKDYSGKWGAPTFGLADFNLVKRPSFNTFTYLVQQSR